MTDKQDVVELLKHQHLRIRELFEEVATTKGDDRVRAFRELIHLLAVHETAEEEVVHPFAARDVDGGEQVVADRIKEEESAKRKLSRLEDLDPDSPEFLDLFIDLRHEVEAHADAEERYEFSHLRHVADRDRLERLAGAVRAAEALAPTRPHPGADTAMKNIAVGPVAAVVDRTRDVIRKAMGNP